MKQVIQLITVFLPATLAASHPIEAATQPVRVFIRAGQSNTEGYGRVRTLARLGEKSQCAPLLKKIRQDDGSWVVRDDVFVSFHGGKTVGPLSVGFGADGERVGPEMKFGAVMAEAMKEMMEKP